MDEKKALVDQAAGVVTGLAKPLYEDLVQPAAKELGQGLRTVASAIHVALAPVSALIWSYEQIRNYVEDALLEKLKGVPPERLVSPNPAVAGPAIEALRFAGHEATLRDLYANLLAASLDARTARLAHPAYVEIIRQLAPDEARIMSRVAQIAPMSAHTSTPIVSLKVTRSKRKGYSYGIRYLSLLPYEAGCAHLDLGPTYLENIARLGLLELREDMTLSAEGAYGALEAHPVVEDAKNRLAMADATVDVTRGIAMTTTLGATFIQACVLSPAGLSST